MATLDNRMELNGKQYYCRQWNATKAMQMNARLISNMGGLAFKFVDGTWETRDLAGVMSEAPDDLIPMLTEFVCTARIDGKTLEPFEFDMEYSGDLLRIFKVFSFVASTNYKDFFAQG